MKEAYLYEKDANMVVCRLCPHACRIAEGGFGVCGVRQVKDGVLYTHAYGKAIAASKDPIEKKPFFHVMPGTRSLSIATAGCNFRCSFCQNWQISQLKNELPGEDFPVDEVIKEAEGCGSIAYTYTEPTIFFEYAYDIARKAREHKHLFVTNGYITGDAIRMLSHYLDAVNIDLKGFSDDFYRKVCGARLQPVLDAIRLYHELGVFVEITTLIVPGYTDNEETLNNIAEFIASVDPFIPWHISRFSPHYKMQETPATPEETVERAIEIGREKGLKYIYPGNMPGHALESTFCHNCGKRVIERRGYHVGATYLNGKKCSFCGTELPLLL